MVSAGGSRSTGISAVDCVAGPEGNARAAGTADGSKGGIGRPKRRRGSSPSSFLLFLWLWALAWAAVILAAVAAWAFSAFLLKGVVFL